MRELCTRSYTKRGHRGPASGKISRPLAIAVTDRTSDAKPVTPTTDTSNASNASNASKASSASNTSGASALPDILDTPHTADNTARYGETLRFLMVALAGFVIDTTVVWSLINFYAVPEQLACVIGFALATAGCFFAHKSWTFRNAPQATLWRFLGYWTITLFTLVVRLVLFTQLGEAFSRDELPIPVRLAIAGGIAFVLAYLLSNKLVFRGETTL